MTTELKLQPPPGVPAPPPGMAAVHSRRWMKGIVWMGLASMVLLAGIVAAPRLVHRCRGCGISGETNNARQLGMALFDFEDEYGRFPDDTTIADVKRKTGSSWMFGTSTSNEFLKQLIAAGITQSEGMFYVRYPGAKRPDNLIDTEARTLAPGECGFSYILGGSIKSDPARPLAVTRLIPGTHLFDRQCLQGKAVVLLAGCSVQSYPITRDGRVMIDGKDLFDPSQPFWRGIPPVVKWPAGTPP